MDQNIENKQGDGSKESLKQRLEQSGKRIRNEESNIALESSIDNERLRLKNRLKDTKKNRVLVIEKINSESEQKDNVNNTINNSHRKKTWLLIILLSIVFLIVAALCTYLIVSINFEKEKQEISKLNYENNVKINKIGPSQKSFVDLGLPSGTLWAICNVGATKPEEFGDYFAWGEVAPKFYYDNVTYKWWYDGYWTKYSCSLIELKETLEFSDDVASVNWGENCRIPTKTEQQELIFYTKCRPHVINGVDGIELTSIMNGNTIFFPASGYKIVDTTIKKYILYWSSSLDVDVNLDLDSRAFCMKTDNNGYLILSSEYRSNGLPVRPVKNKYIAE